MPGLSETFTAWLKSFGPVPPFALPIPTTQKILGDKSRTMIYEAVGRRELNAVKDGARTLITVESIKRYCAAMAPAEIKPPTPRKKTWPVRPPRSAAAKMRKTRRRQAEERKAEAAASSQT
jgi:hypothetical protein